METLDWKNLPFKYMKTGKNLRSYFKNGKWSSLEISESEYIQLHMAATSLHYGQEAFEGLKAYMGKDGKIRVFRVEENARRMTSSARGILMEAPSEDLFIDTVKQAVKLNKEFVPPYGSGASLYIRPLLFGTGAEVGVRPSIEYQFIVFVTPVGPYFKKGFKPVDLVIYRDKDRAAPLGTGHLKVGGNYAASLMAADIAKKDGYAAVLYLDAKEKKYIDEAGPANFFGIKNNTYITPDSNSILPSITNKSLQILAADMGMKVEKRQIPIEELNEFEEVGACGTAAVISPIHRIVDEQKNKVYSFGNADEPGPISTRLYKRLRAIQYGEKADKFGWTTIINV